MKNSVYIATAESDTGKSLVSLGIMELFLRNTSKVGYFRPIIKDPKEGREDRHIELILNHFKLDQSYEESFALKRSEASALISEGKHAILIDKVISGYKKLENRCDLILIEGTDLTSQSSGIEFNMNAELAHNLSSPIIIVGNARGRTMEETIRRMVLATESFAEQDCQVIGTVANRVPLDEIEHVKNGLKSSIRDQNIQHFVLPDHPVLASPTMQEVAEHLSARVLYGKNQMNNKAYRFSIAAMQMENYLGRLTENCMVITPGDRTDVVLGTLMAHHSAEFPPVSGIILTGGIHPSETLQRVLNGQKEVLPILLVETNTYETAAHLGSIHPDVTKDNLEKIQLSLKLFEEYVDVQLLEEIIGSFRPKGMTPKMFEFNLTQKAKSQKKHIVLPEGEDPRILLAAQRVMKSSIADITLLGNIDQIKNTVAQQGLQVDLDAFKIIQPNNNELQSRFISDLVRLRGHKGVTESIARDLVCDVSYFGTMMVNSGLADGMVSGAVHTTQHTIRPALQIIKTKADISIVSSVFFMCLDDRVLVYGDCAVNPNPTAEQLASIAISSAETAIAFGIEPKVAMLSYSSGSSGKGEEVEKVREATEIAKKARPDLLLEGPIQYDAAVDLGVGQKKMPGSKVAGQASVLIFPDLNTGNNTYKAVQRETGAIAIGPVLQGLNKPVNDLSRGALVDDIVNTIIITAIQAQGGSN